MAKITAKDSIVEPPETVRVEAAIEEFVKKAENQSAEVLKNIVFVALGLIDNPEDITPQFLANLRQRLAQLDKNVSASMDVMRGVNLFLQTMEGTEK